MTFTPCQNQIDSSLTYQAIAFALVGMLLLSAIGGVIGGGIAAAQTNDTAPGGGNNTPSGNATTGGNTTALQTPGSVNESSLSNTSGNASGNGSVSAVIQDFKQSKVGYNKLSSDQKSKVKKQVRNLTQAQKKLDSGQKINQYQKVYNAFGYKRVLPFSKESKNRNQISNILDKHVNAQESAGVPPKSLPPKKGPLSGIDIPGMMDAKLDSMADTLKEGASNVLGQVYDLAFSTPVPQNNGWQGVFGTPTNQPFQQLHQQLLSEKLYPLTNILLGMSVLVMGISMTVNPLMIKFVSFLMLYVASWAVVTLLHGAVNDITLWLRPSKDAMAALATNVEALSAGAIGAYFVGAGGILTTVFGLGLELSLRRIALQYFLPYIFPVLLLLLYVSPWQRLKSFASVILWQYVNILTMVIPMAILLKAAAIASFSTSGGVQGMLLLIGLFLMAVSVPGITTYTFLQIPGKAGQYGKVAAAGAVGHASTAKGRLSGGSEDSSSSATTTGDTSPGDRTEEAVEVSTNGERSGVPSSGELSDDQIESMDADGGSTPTTTAGKVRDLDNSENQDPMNPSAMKESYFDDDPRRETMNEKLANK
jgi:hypothetical protein